MFEKFKPMLAETCSGLSQVKFPVFIGFRSEDDL